MKIEKVPISKLKPASYNPRQLTEKQKEDLKESIKRFGLVEPLLCNKHKGRENTVIGGHQRLNIALELGIKEVDVIYLDLTEKQERELNIRLNKNLGEWDFDALANEFDLEDLKDFGFDDKDLKLIDIEPEEDKFDVEANKPIKPKSKRGEIYQLGRHRLMCGDATSKEDVAKLMDGNKADMVFTDPPYGVGYKYNSHDDDMSDHEYESFCRDWFDNLKLFSDFIVITTGHKHKRMWYKIDDSVEEMVWLKKNGQSPGFVSYLLKTEPILVYGKCPKDKYDMDLFEHLLVFSDDLKNKHSCPKPISLIAKIITPQTDKDDIVLDLFGGSGSTLIACEQTNRTCYAMEIDPTYCDVIIKRYEDYTQKNS